LPLERHFGLQYIVQTTVAMM